MIRTLPLTSATYDVLVVGGGIYGLTIAADAAQRGLSVALVERGDFGSGTSFNHLRTIHGGLRYLQTLDLARARESIAERRTLALIAPQFIQRVPFVLPLRSAVVRGPWMMRAGFLLDAVVARDRNAGVAEPLRLPAAQVLSAETARRRFPALGAAATHGAAVWYDYITTEADRLTFAWALSAAQAGAVLANYAEATSLRVDGGRVVGARLLDRVSGASLEVASRVLINATGADIDGLLTADRLETRTPMLRAMNLVTRLPADGAAIGGITGSGRALFMVPWRGRALFGTWESSTVCQPGGATAPSASDVAGFLQEVRAAYPVVTLTERDITLVHRGIVPAAVSPGGVVKLEGHQQVRDHSIGAHPIDGLISVAGTKYTTARAVAEQITDRIVAKVGRRTAPCRTATTALPAADAWTSIAQQEPSLARAIDAESAVTGAQLVWAVRHEMALTLADAVIRRTPLGALGHPGRAVLDRAAAIVASEAGWDPARTAAEIQAVDAFYQRGELAE